MSILSTKLARLFDFIPGTKAQSAQVDAEFNQLINQQNNSVDDLNALNAAITTANAALSTHKGSGDHDGRYYTETEVDGKFTTHDASGDHDGRYYTETEVNGKFTTHNASGDHDGRYYTETEINAKLGTSDDNLAAHKASDDHAATYLRKDKATQTVNYYVDVTTGSDSNTGLNGSPFKTIKKAISVLPDKLENIYNINVTDGNYASEGVISIAGLTGSLNGALQITGGTYSSTIVDSFALYGNNIEVLLGYFTVNNKCKVESCNKLSMQVIASAGAYDYGFEFYNSTVYMESMMVSNKTASAFYLRNTVMDIGTSLSGSAGNTKCFTVYDGSVISWYTTPSVVANTYDTDNTVQILDPNNARIDTKPAYVSAVEDAGYYFGGTNVESVLQEVGASLTDKTNILNFPVSNNIVNGNFANGTANWTAVNGSVLSAASNTLSVVGSNVSQIPRVIQDLGIRTGNRKIYVKMTACVDNSACVGFIAFLRDGSGTTFGYGSGPVRQSYPTINQWYTVSGIIDVNATLTNNLILYFEHGYADAATANGKTLKIQNVSVIDLTAAFGQGKEPSQIEMDYLMSYYPNSWFDGTVNPFRGLKDIGTRALFADFPAKNLVINGDFSNGTTGWTASGSSISNVSGALQVVESTIGAAGYGYQAVAGYRNNDKIYLRASYNLSTTLAATGYIGLRTKGSSVGNTVLLTAVSVGAGVMSGIKVITDSTTENGVYLTVYDPTTAVTCTFDNVVALNLTTIFGAGNEPSAAEMDRMLAKFPNNWFDGTVNPLLSTPNLLVYANKNKANIVQEELITPTLINSWTAYDTNTVGYYKDSFGIVHFSVSIKGGGVGGTIAFTLPSGYLPAKTLRFAVVSNNLFAVIAVFANGNVYAVTNNNAQIHLDGVEFMAGR
jgi:hypothetical protein